MNQEKQDSNHHVAWKDRLGLNQQWMRDIQACSQAHGTEDYVNQVDRFRNDIINIKNGPKLYDIINKRWTDIIAVDGSQSLKQWIQTNPQESRIEEEVTAAQERIRQAQAESLYHYIVQTLEENGFGFYQSDIPEDEISLSDLD